MGSDGVLRSCLVTLGAAVFLVGIFTFSFKKMMATYFFGLIGIAGLVLPDWEFFDRDFSEWFSPMTVQRPPISERVSRVGSIKRVAFNIVTFNDRFKFYPLRAALITTIYSFGLHKWWMIMSS